MTRVIRYCKTLSVECVEEETEDGTDRFWYIYETDGTKTHVPMCNSEQDARLVYLWDVLGRPALGGRYNFFSFTEEDLVDYMCNRNAPLWRE